MNINKLIKIASLFMIIGVVFTSCEDDDTVANESLVNSPTQVKIEFTDQNNDITITEGDSVDLTASLSQSLTYDAIMTIDIVSSDGSLSTSGVSEVAFTATATLPAGQTTATFSLTFTDDEITDTTETYTVSIVDFESVDGTYPTTSFLIGGDISRTINVENGLVQVVTVAGDVNIALTWASGQDMDLRLFEKNQSTANQIDGSFSVSSVETVTLTSAQPDGDYTVWIEEWFGLSAPVDYTLTLDFPGGEQSVFNGTVTADGFYLIINKSTNGADVTYTLTQL